MRLRSALALATLTLAAVSAGASTATAATAAEQSDEKPIDSTITLTIESVTEIDPVLVVGCLAEAAASPVAPEAALVECLTT
ncbi:hypothetical protein ACTWP5_28730 [Streptomyces sp. 4N509B]|uniref:hypothetical protein n=1 Tax=Streptomyces sp. 4N509B TaxID=3457413 RepID=UPI003FD00FC1